MNWLAPKLSRVAFLFPLIGGPNTVTGGSVRSMKWSWVVRMNKKMLWLIAILDLWITGAVISMFANLNLSLPAAFGAGSVGWTLLTNAVFELLLLTILATFGVSSIQLLYFLLTGRYRNE